jgi:hypothetical protein
MSGFSELTYVHHDDSGEVYVDIQDDGTVLDVYVDRDCWLIEQTIGLFNWEEGKNPLFLHSDDPQKTFAFMETNGWITNG